jgi:hypothetical protein
MKLLIVLSIFATCLAAAEGQAKKATPPPKVIKPLEIPKGAVETEPGTYRYTDTAGKKWIYRKTPFGVARLEDKGDQQAAAARAKSESYRDVHAFEEGDLIRFERKSPFGVSQWKTKKSELNDMEREVWEREKAQTTKKD